MIAVRFGPSDSTSPTAGLAAVPLVTTASPGR